MLWHFSGRFVIFWSAHVWILWPIETLLTMLIEAIKLRYGFFINLGWALTWPMPKNIQLFLKVVHSNVFIVRFSNVLKPVKENSSTPHFLNSLLEAWISWQNTLSKFLYYLLNIHLIANMLSHKRAKNK